jgi:threonine/homoserine/homoserine lactone efflux protein
MEATLLPLVLFTLANSLTPGPNNLMLTASGASFGYVRTLPHIAGILVGFPVMTLAVGMGLGELFQRYPVTHEILKWGGTAYLLYLSWRIAVAGAPETAPEKARPIRFGEAALLQWVNPKGWTMILSSIPAFTTAGGNYYAELFTITGVFAALSFPVASLWCGFGMGIRHFLRNQTAVRVVNLTLATALAASALLLFR